MDNNTDLVKWNVGGTHFTTSRSTLDRSLFLSTLVDKYKPNDSSIFLDNDPVIFRHVLNVLRFGPDYNFPDRYLFALDYFGIDRDNASTEMLKPIPWKLYT